MRRAAYTINVGACGTRFCGFCWGRRLFAASPQIRRALLALGRPHGVAPTSRLFCSHGIARLATCHDTSLRLACAPIACRQYGLRETFDRTSLLALGRPHGACSRHVATTYETFHETSLLALRRSTERLYSSLTPAICRCSRVSTRLHRQIRRRFLSIHTNWIYIILTWYLASLLSSSSTNCTRHSPYFMQ